MFANQSCSKPLQEAPKSSGSAWLPESNWETWALRGQMSDISEITVPIGFSCQGKRGPFKRIRRGRGQALIDKYWTNPKNQKENGTWWEKIKCDEVEKTPSFESVGVLVLILSPPPLLMDNFSQVTSPSSLSVACAEQRIMMLSQDVRELMIR